MIDRQLRLQIEKKLKPNKAVLIFGARRVGKTILIKDIVSKFSGKAMILNGEDFDTLALLEERSVSNYRRLLQGVDLLVIDEAQNIPDIGAKLKLIVDEIDGIKIIASGSSSFDLMNRAGEPLVGRASQFILTPFSQNELCAVENVLETRQNIETRLIYGSYPEVVTMDNNDNRAEYLLEIVRSYLLKDILAVDGVKNSNKMRQLLQLIAFQVGSEVSFDELGKQIGISKNTVERYLDLLSKTFVVYRLGAFARNLRKEVSKSGKWMFYDLGVRNAIINDFRPLALRQDEGLLWENYIINERIKCSLNNNLNKNFHFWRTYDMQEIDLIEVDGTNIAAFEIKRGTKSPSAPIAFSNAYPEATYNVINKNTYLDYITQR